MSERIIIEAEPREIIGKQTNQLRREGWIPGVIYGQKTLQSVQMEQKALRRALRVVGTTHLASLTVGGKTHTVLVREIQQHATRGDILHVDFMEVDMKVKLRAEAELVGIGEAIPEAEGLGVVTQMLREVEIECLPDNLVSQIEYDLSLIRTPDDIITVSDLSAPKGVEILTDPDQVIARFEFAVAEEEEEGVDEASSVDAVEVITKGKKEEEEF